MTEIQEAFSRLIDPDITVTDVQSVSGGSISEAYCVRTLDSGGRTHKWFVKSNRVSFLGNFQAESEGLARLGESVVMVVPRPIAVGVIAGRSWFVAEWVEQGNRRADYFSNFACSLARLHESTLGDRIGLDHDNFIGATPQINSSCQSWTEFMAVHRLGFQLARAVDGHLAESRLRSDAERVIATLDQLLTGRDDATSLLHGDLWSGNYLCGTDGEVVLIDPAIYYGCREAEFGMLKLFGSCPDSFYEAYLNAFPLPSGWQRRVNVYVLYHLLNHLNLFGSGYHDQCQAVAADILRQ